LLNDVHKVQTMKEEITVTSPWYKAPIKINYHSKKLVHTIKIQILFRAPSLIWNIFHKHKEQLTAGYMLHLILNCVLNEYQGQWSMIITWSMCIWNFTFNFSSSPYVGQRF
jgi:hypothetical protein